MFRDVIISDTNDPFDTRIIMIRRDFNDGMHFILSFKYSEIDPEYLESHHSEGFSIDRFATILNPSRERCHCIGSPAILYYRHDVMIQEIWMCDGIIHRDNGPAITYYNYEGEYNSSGGYSKAEVWFSNDLVHRGDSPAKIYYYEDQVRSWEWFFRNSDESCLVDEWLSSNSSIYGLSSDWREWSTDDRIIFKLVYNWD